MIEGTSSNLLFFLKCHFLFGLSYWNIKYERASFQDGPHAVRHRNQERVSLKLTVI